MTAITGYEFDQGDRVKDEVSGFEGIVTGRTDYYNGCVQYLVSGKSEDNKAPHKEWIDEAALVLVTAGERPPKVDEERPGGPATPPPGLR